jgi:hypothetical protein
MDCDLDLVEDDVDPSAVIQIVPLTVAAQWRPRVRKWSSASRRRLRIVRLERRRRWAALARRPDGPPAGAEAMVLCRSVL